MLPEHALELDSYGLLDFQWPPPTYTPLQTPPPASYNQSPVISPPLTHSFGERLTTIRSAAAQSSRDRRAGTDSPRPEADGLKRSNSESRRGYLSVPEAGHTPSRQKTPVSATLQDWKVRFQQHGISAAKSSGSATPKSRTPSGSSLLAFWRPHFDWSSYSGKRAKEDVDFPDPVEGRPIFPRKRNTIAIAVMNIGVAAYLLTDLYYTLDPSSYSYRIFFSLGVAQALECGGAILMAVFSLWVIGGVLFKHRAKVAAEKKLMLPAAITMRNNSHSGSASSPSRGSAKKRHCKVVTFLTIMGVLTILPIILVALLAVLHKNTKPVAPLPSCDAMGFQTTIDLDATSAYSYGFATIYPSEDKKKKLYMTLDRFLPPYLGPTANFNATSDKNDTASISAVMAYNFTGNIDSQHKVEILYENDMTTWTSNRYSTEKDPISNMTFSSITPRIGTFTTTNYLEFPSLPNSPISRKSEWRVHAFSPKLDFELIPWHDRFGDRSLFRFVGDKRLGNGENIDCAAKIRACALGSYDSNEVLVPAGVLLVELAKIKNTCYR